MTAYLQPGDTIVVAAPASVSGNPSDDEITAMITGIYAEQGIKVHFVALVNPASRFEIVSVLRPAREVSSPTTGKLKLVEDIPPLRAHWAPPWQNPEEPHGFAPSRIRHDTPPQYLDPQ